MTSAIDEAHHLVRYVPWSKLRKVVLEDGSEKVEGPAYNAFSLRPEEDYLSTNWLEFYSGDRAIQMLETVRLTRKVRDVGKKSAFAYGVAGEIRKTCEKRKHQIRIVHAADGDNISHAEVRRFPRDDLELEEMLSASSWSRFALNTDFPG
jgi:hypothetical protein